MHPTGEFGSVSEGDRTGREVFAFLEPKHDMSSVQDSCHSYNTSSSQTFRRSLLFISLSFLGDRPEQQAWWSRNMFLVFISEHYLISFTTRFFDTFVISRATLCLSSLVIVIDGYHRKSFKLQI
jgi:hypothetical protein